MRDKSLLLLLALLIAFSAQVSVGYYARGFKPFWEVLDQPPTSAALSASAFGDKQFLYRVLVAGLQTGGDEGGRIVPLKDYDIKRVVAWLDSLDLLDSRAEHHIALAMNLFSLSQRTEDVAELIRYAQRHVALNPERKLQWLSPAIMLAEVRLKNIPLAIEVADQLASYDFPNMKPVGYMLSPLLRAKSGDLQGALEGMRRARARTVDKATPMDIQFMDDFIADIEPRTKKTPK